MNFFENLKKDLDEKPEEMKRAWDNLGHWDKVGPKAEVVMIEWSMQDPTIKATNSGVSFHFEVEGVISKRPFLSGLPARSSSGYSLEVGEISHLRGTKQWVDLFFPTVRPFKSASKRKRLKRQILQIIGKRY